MASHVYGFGTPPPRTLSTAPERPRTAQERFFWAWPYKWTCRATKTAYRPFWRACVGAFPPHAWGCTCFLAFPNLGKTVYPTRVGMYSLRLFDAVLLPSFPHTRGDVLRLWVFQIFEKPCVHPLPAGVHLQTSLPTETRLSSSPTRWSSSVAPALFLRVQLFIPRPGDYAQSGKIGVFLIQGQAVFVPKFHISGRQRENYSQCEKTGRPIHQAAGVDLRADRRQISRPSTRLHFLQFSPYPM